MQQQTMAKPKQSFINALLHAANGILHFITFERNGRIQFAVSCMVMLAAYFLRADTYEYIIIIFSIAAVIVTEMINTAIEKLCDFIEPTYHPSIKIIKDVAAGAVMVAAAVSIIAGSLIFLPKLF